MTTTTAPLLSFVRLDGRAGLPVRRMLPTIATYLYYRRRRHEEVWCWTTWSACCTSSRRFVTSRHSHVVNNMGTAIMLNALLPDNKPLAVQDGSSKTLVDNDAIFDCCLLLLLSVTLALRIHIASQQPTRRLPAPS